MIFRIAEKKTNFTTLPNALLRTEEIGPDSLGVLCYLLSHTTTWVTTGKQLAAHFGCSTDKITRITKELESAGYLRRVWRRDQKNPQQTRPDWDVSDVPNEFPERDQENPDSALTGSGNSGSDTRSTKEQEVLSINNISKKEQVCRNPPSGVSESAWRKWWEYKCPTNRAPTKRIVTSTTNAFSILVKAGVKDFDKLVDYTIAKGWKGIGDETYHYTKTLIDNDTNKDVLAAVK